MNFKNFTLMASMALMSISINTNAQDRITQTSSSITPATISQLQLIFPENSEKINLKNVDGSIYENEEFKEGILYDTEKDRNLQLFVRFDVFNDRFEVKENDYSKDIFILDRTDNFKIFFKESPEKRFVFFNSLPINDNNNGYLYKLIDNDLKLFKHYTKMYYPPEPAKNSYESSKKARLVDNVSYFIQNEEFNFIEVNLNKRKIIDDFPAHQKELKNYIKDKKLKFRGDDEEKDLIQLVEYYNTL